jgi:type IV secretory pathway TrbL component
MSELVLFYALLLIPVLMGLAYGFYSYRSYATKKKRRTS